MFSCSNLIATGCPPLQQAVRAALMLPASASRTGLLLPVTGSAHKYQQPSAFLYNSSSQRTRRDSHPSLSNSKLVHSIHPGIISKSNCSRHQVSPLFSSTPAVRWRSTFASKLVERSPTGIQPYMRLARLDKPVGTWLLFWPCGWSLGLAAKAGSLPDPTLLALFGVGAFVMRGAGCTINDMWDRNIDKFVQRTKDRPLSSGQVTMFDALVFLAGQLGTGLLILLELNWYSVLLGASSMGLVTLYPVMKRFTYYPQLVLGLAFNWGALLGWSATHGICNWNVCLSLYAAGISWTMIYDTIYAHQDKYDDIIIGMKSTAIKFGERTPVCLSCFATTMGLSLVYAGWLVNQTWPYYSAVAAVLAHISHQLYTLDIHDREDCAKKFLSNRWVGLILFLGCVGGTYLKEEDEVVDVTKIIQDAAAANVLKT